MKIGILTYPLNNNYGCYLQSYALLHFLREKGCEAEYIFRRHDRPSISFYIRYALSTLIKNVKNRVWNSLLYDVEWHYMQKKGGRLYPFFENNIVPHTVPIYTTLQLKKVCADYDVIIVGSDQVWRAEILSNIEDYFLVFLGGKPVRRIAYAASFGKGDPRFTKSQIISCGKAISKFDAVSVREDVGLDIIRGFNWKCPICQVVLDPTLLLSKEDYLPFARDKMYPTTVFGYLLDQSEQKESILNDVSEMMNIDSYNIIKGSNEAGFNYPPVSQWLGYLSKAKFVVTDSFHGMAFSIIFNKPFFVIVNFERGASRFTSLLKMFDLEDRILQEPEDLDKLINNDINWERVNSLLLKKRKESVDFLMNSINIKSSEIKK